MKIRITIEAINDEDHIVSSQSGEVDASGSVLMLNNFLIWALGN